MARFAYLGEFDAMTAPAESALGTFDSAGLWYCKVFRDSFGPYADQRRAETVLAEKLNVGIYSSPSFFAMFRIAGAAAALWAGLIGIAWLIHFAAHMN